MLKTLEQQYRFQYPELYHRLYADQMLDIGEYASHWSKEVYPRLKNHPPLFLYSGEFELIPVANIVETIEELNGEESWFNINPDYLFIPFGQTGGGDYYCFLYNQNVPKPTPPIALLQHDSDEAELLANTLEDFFFYEMLNSVNDIYEGSLVRSEGDFYENITRLLQSHLPYINDEAQRQVLQEVYSRKLTDFTRVLPRFTQIYQGLLSDEELEQLLQQYIPIAGEKTFVYTTENEVESTPLRYIDGTLYVRVSPIPAKNDKVYDALKALNWRQNKAVTDRLEYSKKMQLYYNDRYGIPWEEYILGAFKERIEALKKFPNVTVTFEEEQI
ncbi:SMI1/KNR4 family protein [Capnocytophaga genosp. AHN8471]|uniref:SMI1/KNR4 family protein n=1 Tax=Capnocytophaga genosp. AHN8471 TaxID=327574 RepID=UPI0019347667|nr:SMI1/KNR4 family protein [Capnocytophaga genosp. AHN8471]MBM0659912.1 SMI1/KNR4 family protein [Capnocytophaga genosp. AHN8471]